ncbi:MAG: aldo/keto reductase [Nocardioidaceae bacterium]
MRRLGSTDVGLGELGFGGAGIGNLYRAVDDATARAAVRTAHGAGIRYFDTAPHYGLGLSERRLGEALAELPRDGYVLSTKVGRLLEPHPAPTGSDLTAGGYDVPDDLVRRFDFSADGVRRSLESSLERLGTDHVDVVFVHDPDEHLDQAVAEAVPALLALRDEGVIGAVGVGMNGWMGPARMVREADLDVVMLAGRWTLLDRSGLPLLEECLARGVSVVAAAPYNSGLLARPRPTAEAHFDYGQVPPEILERARALADLCEASGTELPAAALQFPLRHPAVATVVAGLRSPDEVTESVRRFTQGIDEQTWRDLDDAEHGAGAAGLR